MSDHVGAQDQAADRRPVDEQLADEQLFEDLPYEPRTMGQMAWRAFRRHKPAMFGLVVILLMVLGAIFAPVVSPYDPDKTDLDNILAPPSVEHPMGTDELGRDLATRILYGGRVSLSIGVMAMALAVLVGAIVGGLAGYYGGWIDNFLMRIVDMMLSFPSLFVLIILALALRDLPIEALRGTAFASVFSIVLVIAVLSWMTVARLVRASFLSLKEQDFLKDLLIDSNHHPLYSHWLLLRLLCQMHLVWVTNSQVRMAWSNYGSERHLRNPYK